MKNIDEIIEHIRAEFEKNPDTELLMVSRDDETIKKLSVRRDANEVIHVTESCFESENSSGILFELKNKLLETERHYNLLDIDIDFMRSIHPEHDENWESNIDKGWKSKIRHRSDIFNVFGKKLENND